jgi:hypothetical protein
MCCPHGGKIGEPGFRWLRHFDAYLPFTVTLVVRFRSSVAYCRGLRSLGLSSVHAEVAALSGCAARWGH